MSTEEKSWTNSVPQHFICPLSGYIFAEPFLANDGLVYEKDMLLILGETRKLSPVTNQLISLQEIQFDQELFFQILLYLQQHPHLFEQNAVYLPKYYIVDFCKALQDNLISTCEELVLRDPRLIFKPLDKLFAISNREEIQSVSGLFGTLLWKQKGISFTREWDQRLQFSGFTIACMLQRWDIVYLMLHVLKEKQIKILSMEPNLKTAIKTKALTKEIYSAIKQGNLKQVQFLASMTRPYPNLKHKLLEQVIQGESNALYIACKDDQLEIVKYLVLEEGCQVNVSGRSDGMTPLQIACYKNHNQVVAFLLDQVDVDYNLGDKVKQMTPLHEICRMGHANLLQLLLTKQRTDYPLELLCNTSQGSKQSPLHYACVQGHLQCVSLLLSYASKCYLMEQLLENQNAEGRTPLQECIICNQVTILQYIFTHYLIDLQTFLVKKQDGPSFSKWIEKKLFVHAKKQEKNQVRKYIKEQMRYFEQVYPLEQRIKELKQ